MSEPDKYLTELLKLVADHDGGWSWYQLDRALSARGLMPTMPLPAVLRDAEEKGLIRSAAGRNPSQTVYSITDTGRARILP
jgi:hypothetical protein